MGTKPTLPGWPGFEPDRIPLAVFDGERTVLTGHPDPPPEFEREGDVWVHHGLHPEVRADTAVPIGEVMTATLLSPSPETVDSQAAHEKFHVFQKERHPTWGADEVQAFAYPVTDAALLAMRRMEAVALRRALVDHSAAWTATALRIRADRYARMPDFAVQYERAAEQHEGTAQYMEGLQRCSAGLESTPPPEDIRRSVYSSGEALALLLDGFVPTWKDRVEDEDAWLDEVLAEHIEAVPAEFTDAERDRFTSEAERAVELLLEQRIQWRSDFFLERGRATFTATAGPFECAGFDPMNVKYLGDGEVLHTRWLRLRGPGFAAEVMDGAAITHGPEDNPIFGGIDRAHF